MQSIIDLIDALRGVGQNNEFVIGFDEGRPVGGDVFIVAFDHGNDGVDIRRGATEKITYETEDRSY